MTTVLSLVHSWPWTASRLDERVVATVHTLRTVDRDGEAAPTDLDGTLREWTRRFVHDRIGTTS